MEKSFKVIISFCLDEAQFQTSILCFLMVSLLDFMAVFLSVNQHSEMSSHTYPTLQDFAKEYLVVIFDTIKEKKYYFVI